MTFGDKLNWSYLVTEVVGISTFDLKAKKKKKFFYFFNVWDYKQIYCHY